ncbi:hypothetical protein CHLNCDRAFT_133701 [Chlorella variabilis]|uniref:SPX domain-containing protein n=1 Tax=Chlorella variabilis TaxID=554065 RepID=E1Z3L9_CHLVA|nr:hypothetical protein CHLNCDRAFT_133701 [Chlorella variabilis]EFN60186.1 hypothetical protein CHLNCDRAFT_133701 [Chlorella variabilis]|eukprot:XP_005852288.1 hypothetical protein CHLNCDRAFT_133701 [Chlorella variabilis]
MKFGHLLKSFEADAALPDTKLKKLIKSQTKHQHEASAAEPADAAAAADGAAAPAAEKTAAPATAGIPPASDPAAADGAAAIELAGGIAEEDREFVATLNTDLSRVNSYFMEKEEEAVIRLRELEDRLEAAREGLDAPDLEQLRNELVDFHGELVLMLHWSLVNYAAVAKILKKHDKMTGSRLRAPVLASVLHQPFLSTESISQLVKEAERHVQELSHMYGKGTRAEHSGDGDSSAGAASRDGGGDPEAAAGAMGESHVAIYKRTRAALNMEGASTPSTLLPPSAANSDAAPDGKKQRTGGKAKRQAASPSLDDSVP